MGSEWQHHATRSHFEACNNGCRPTGGWPDPRLSMSVAPTGSGGASPRLLEEDVLRSGDHRKIQM